MKRREVKSKGEKERYKHLNAEFQRIARRDKKAFFSDQCKEIEENNRLGKTRDLSKKIRDTERIFHAKIDTIKDRIGMGLTKAEDVKKWSQEYTELYKKDLHDQDNHDGVITDLEPNILECEVKWALESITVNKTSAMQATWVLSLGWEDPLEKEMATHSSILALRIPGIRGAWWTIDHGVTKSGT